MRLSRSRLKEQYRSLAQLNVGAAASEKRQRGLEFEAFLHALLEAEGLEPRTRFRPEGEEIDGSFLLDGRVYLVEAKWHASPLAASSIYAFRGKVDGKLMGTLGVSISMSGYGDDAANALTLGKGLNTILFDQGDIDACVSGPATFTEILRRKLRAAAEEGVVYLPTRTKELVSQRIPETKEIRVSEAVVDAEQPRRQAVRTVVVVCEGPTDEAILSRLTARILKDNDLEAVVRFVPAMGKEPLPRMVNALRSVLPPETHFIIVTDSDGDVWATERLVRQGLDAPVDGIVIPHPSIEAWLAPGAPAPKETLMGRMSKRGPSRLQGLADLTAGLDIEGLKASDPSFAAYCSKIVAGASGRD